ncbi:MAG: hypothetical protein CMM44_11615 [Rhodospirillaceae bacterium]|nr:hypothetical protein [Rhodospirillaceae bacterium]
MKLNTNKIFAPQIDANSSDLKVVEIKVSNFQKVSKNDHILSLESTKVVEEIYSEFDGYIKLLVKTDDEIVSGSALALISNSQKELKSSNIEVKKLNSQKKEIQFTKKAIELIKKNNLDTALFKEKKLVNEKLVLEYLNLNNVSTPKNQSTKLSAFQKEISKNVINSQMNNAFTHMNILFDYLEIDKKIKILEKKNNISLSIIDLFFLKLPEVLGKYPKFMSYLDNDSIIKHEEIKINFTVDYNEKLYMPSILLNKKKNINEIIKLKFDVIRKIYLNKYKSSEKDIGCISIAQIESVNVMFHYPIIFKKQSSIIGLNGFKKPSNNYISNSPSLTLTYDHRLINGKYAANFLDELINNLFN